MKYYPNYPTHRLFFGEIKTPYSLELLPDIRDKKILPVEFLSRQLESIHNANKQRKFDWILSVSTGSKRPRYAILRFQKSRNDDDHKNSYELDNLDIRNFYVEFNGLGQRYPDHNLELKFT